MKRLSCFILFASSAFAADAALIEKGRAEEKRACIGCHALRITHVQRLSRAQWDKELTKMTGWGAMIKERDALLEYLTASFGDDKPAAPLARSENGTRK
jgi:mono/diheme cytochrome c family protein